MSFFNKKNYLFVMPKSAAKSSGGYNVFPIGITYVTAYLKKYGDFNIFTSNLEFKKEDTYNALKNLFIQHKIDVICVGGLSRDYHRIKEVLDCAKKINPKVITIVGGGIITGDPEPAMEALECDYGVIGQGEITMYELANALDKGKDIKNINGLIYKDKSSNFIKTNTREDIKDLDTIPSPDYDGFDFDKYMKSINYSVAYVFASRSCPYKCTFCFHPSGSKYRRRSLDNIFKDIEYLIKKYPVKYLDIADELFAPKREYVVEFCKRIKPYNISWGVQLRVRDVDQELLYMMRDAGCILISYGIESADDTVLKSMRKKIKLSEIDNALKMTYNANIDIQGGLIFGDIAETVETANNSLKWYDKYPEYGLELNMIAVFPGTQLYNYAIAKGIIKSRIQFLKDGCPLINVSSLNEQEYRDLASNIYVRNMKPKYLPNKFFIKDIIDKNRCTIEVVCNKCNNNFTLYSDFIHITRISCPTCRQRYYIDPFLKIDHSIKLINNQFSKKEKIALWGAGEICIKLLENYDVFKSNNCKIVDISKSRQGYSVCGKMIYSPDILIKEDIEIIIITVIKRKDEVLMQIQDYPNIKQVYICNAIAIDKKNIKFKIIRMNIR